jgi:hypothetical protein
LLRGVCRRGVCRRGVCRRGVCRRGVCRRGVCRRGVYRRGVCRRGAVLRYSWGIQTGVLGAGLELGGSRAGTAELTGGAADRAAPVLGGTQGCAG